MLNFQNSLMGSVAIPEKCSQLIVTLVPNQNHHRAMLASFEKKGGEWCRVLGPFDAVIGKRGITEEKKEGDGKTPSGLYPLLSVFGQEKYRVENMPFISIHTNLEAIDDPRSCYYNQIVDRRIIKEADWKSSEKMQEVGFLYDIGIVVGYNSPNPTPGKGSCIFLHVYRSLEEGTAGCTALSFEEIQTIAKWLDQDRSPHIMQIEVPKAQ